MGAVPIIMGPQREFIFRLLPPYSFLHVEDFRSPQDLATYLSFINKTFKDGYLQFHGWRNSLEVLDETTPSAHLCRICEALNFNDKKPKVYGETDLESFLEIYKNCYEN